MTARQYHRTTVYDLFSSRYEVLEPLISFARSNEPYVFDNNLELMSVFTDLINTEEGRAIVNRWHCVFAVVLVDLERFEPVADYADERTASIAYHAACSAIEALTTELAHVIFQS